MLFLFLLGRVSRRWRTVNHKLKASLFPNGGAPGSRAVGGISTALIALRLLSLEAGKAPAERFGAEVM